MRPDFDELVGTDLSTSERERLERVHELLVAAGPPPEAAPMPAPVEIHSRRRRGALLVLAAALAVAAFALGAALVDGGRSLDFTETMTGTPSSADASASLAVFDIDAAGNWPMELTVAGLPPARSGRPFELWLTRDGRLAALCGAFLTDADGSADVPLNAPYLLSDYDGWVVVEEGSKTPLLTEASG